MAITVADVLALPAVAAGRPRVRVGGRALDAVVRWVHISELTEVAGLLRGGELLLSTGMRLRDEGLDTTAYLRSLHERGVAGLVVELSPSLPTLPDRLVDAAREQKFALVELTRGVRFVAITEAVHGQLLHEQYERLRFSEEVQTAFSALTTSGSPHTTQVVLDRASELLGCAVVLEDLAHRALGLAGGAAAEVLASWAQRSRRLPFSTSTVTGGPEDWTACPVGPPGSRWGRVVVPGAALDDQRTLMVLERAAEALTVIRLVSGDCTDPARRASGELLADLLGADRRHEPTLRARARALGLPVPCALLPLAVKHPRPASAEGRSSNERSGGDRSAEDAEAVGRALERTGQTGLVATIGPGTTGVLLVVPGTARATSDATAAAGQGSARDGDDDGVHAAAARAAESLARALATASSSGSARTVPAVAVVVPVVAVAPVTSALVEAGEGLLEACEVAEVASASPEAPPAASAPPAPQGTVYRRQDLGVRWLLWRLRSDPQLQSYVDDQLAPLLHGTPRDVDDLALLEAFLASGGSMTQLASALDANRPSLYARVRRLSERLDRDLGDPETRTSLQVALLAYRGLETASHSPGNRGHSGYWSDQ
ncbi:purine catabolism regulatory protein [Quadrisphaera granulorum]|uniref:Purine catabolism regulator n=1 Tax=Quadrisphaera granulorum TaxID=317664 RepID=A0A316A8S1_9ACTN|nr:PucR family transcriptional regulator [Quadrisphaera granulorum]PWJ53244.1 purine catabolism regulator [Quadrisphaera granulorum]SZE96918.1 purine catabolism regulatory protein [Quadrisphaera granulorum]